MCAELSANNVKKTPLNASGYEEAVQMLENAPQYMELSGCVRAGRLLDKLGRPDRRLRIIHVAGTNGKGSVCAYLDSIIRENGYTAGLFTSPHLNDIRERIRINGEMLRKEEFFEQYRRVADAEKELIQETGVGLAYFDCLFGIAMLAFEKANTDYVIMETGLGGRLDATNAIERPVLEVITTISLEHTQILGGTVEKIAGEKAGIIKKGVPLVYWAQEKAAADVLAEAASAAGAYAVPVDAGMCRILKNTGKHIDFSVHNRYYKNDCFTVRTGAIYQVFNSTLALTAAAVLRERAGVPLDMQRSREAVFHAFWAGRMEEIEKDVYADGAHNPEGIGMLIRSVPAISAGRPVILLFSVVRDKDYREMIQDLCGSGLFSGFYIVQMEGARALSGSCILETFRQHTDMPVRIFYDIREAYRDAKKAQEAQGAVLMCTGSLYLAGAVRSLVKC